MLFQALEVCRLTQYIYGSIGIKIHLRNGGSILFFTCKLGLESIQLILSGLIIFLSGSFVIKYRLRLIQLGSSSGYIVVHVAVGEIFDGFSQSSLCCYFCSTIIKGYDNGNILVAVDSNYIAINLAYLFILEGIGSSAGIGKRFGIAYIDIIGFLNFAINLQHNLTGCIGSGARLDAILISRPIESGIAQSCIHLTGGHQGTDIPLGNGLNAGDCSGF